MLKKLSFLLLLIQLGACVSPPKEEGFFEVRSTSEDSQLEQAAPLPCEFTYQTEDEEARCNAWALSANYFLITAHCLKQGIVRSRITCPQERTFTPIKAIVHEGYRGDFKNDLALINVLENNSSPSVSLGNPTSENATLQDEAQCLINADAIFCLLQKGNWRLIGLNAERGDDDKILVRQSLDKFITWIGAQQRKNATGNITYLNSSYEVDLSELQVACTYKSGREYVLKAMTASMENRNDRLSVNFSYTLKESGIFSNNNNSPTYVIVSQKILNELLSELTKTSGQPSANAVINFFNSGILQKDSDNSWWIKSCKVL